LAARCALPKANGLAAEGLFLNAGRGFSIPGLRHAGAARHGEARLARHPRSANLQADDGAFLAPELCRRRTVIAHANARRDGFKIGLVRNETGNGLAFHGLLFIALLLRKATGQTNS
jgi:hypothetical protein